MIVRCFFFLAASAAATLCSAQGCFAHAQTEASEAPGSDAIASPSFTLIEHRWIFSHGAMSTASRAFLNVQASPRALRPARHAARAGLLPSINEAEARHRLPAGLLDAMIATESAYLVRAVSPAGAAGLAQLMPATARRMGVNDRFDPLQSIEGGARYLRAMLDRFGSVSLALAAYNAGPGAVTRAGGIPLNRETPAYVGRVMRRWLSLAQERA